MRYGIGPSGSPLRIGECMAKFMLSLRDENFQLLTLEAQQRGISVQELIRAVIIPDWVKQAGPVRNVGPSPNNGHTQLVQPVEVRRFGTSYSRQPLR
jgi:hypothetical protein